jgi:hypothetical protein
LRCFPFFSTNFQPNEIKPAFAASSKPCRVNLGDGVFNVLPEIESQIGLLVVVFWRFRLVLVELRRQNAMGDFAFVKNDFGPNFLLSGRLTYEG